MIPARRANPPPTLLRSWKLFSAVPPTPTQRLDLPAPQCGNAGTESCLGRSQHCCFGTKALCTDRSIASHNLRLASFKPYSCSTLHAPHSSNKLHHCAQETSRRFPTRISRPFASRLRCRPKNQTRKARLV